MELGDLEINEYQLYGGACPQEENVRLVRRRQRHGTDKWSISARGDVLDKEGRWLIEGLPSGRTEDFINLTRWDTPEEALAFWERYASKYAKTITVRGRAYAMLDWGKIHADMGG